MFDKKILYQKKHYSTQELEKYFESKIYSIITNQQSSIFDCDIHLLFLTAIKYFKQSNSDYTSALQEIIRMYELAEQSWFFNRSSKITTAIELARFYVISLCEKDLIYIPKYHVYHQHFHRQYK